MRRVGRPLLGGLAWQQQHLGALSAWPPWGTACALDGCTPVSLAAAAAAAAASGSPAALLAGRRAAQPTRGALTVGHTSIPKSRHDPYRTPPRNYVQLLEHIRRARRLPQLAALVRTYGPRFDAVHVAAALSRLPKLYAPPAPGARLTPAKAKQRRAQPAELLSQLQTLAAAQVPRMFVREAAGVTWALGRCRSLLPGGDAHNSATQSLVAELLARLRQDNWRLLYQGADGSQVAQLLHGLAKLRLGKPLARDTCGLAHFVAKRPQRLRARELAASAWALSRMGLGGSAAVRAALDAISQQVVAVKLYLRPASIACLLHAAVRLRWRPQPMLDALCEEAGEQLRSFSPQNLSVLAWALARLGHVPPPALLDGLVAEARRKLEGFGALELGLLLQGLRELKALDAALLGEVASGIAKERAVALGGADAVRILAAFVAAPTAGGARDVEALAARIGDALLARSPARLAAQQMVDLLVCFSKLPAQHRLLLAIVDELGGQQVALSMGAWNKVLQACDCLGLHPDSDPRVKALLAEADRQLQQHLLTAPLPEHAAAEQPAHMQRLDQQQQQQHHQHHQQQHHQQQQHPQEAGAAQAAARPAGLRFWDAADLGRRLAQQRALSEASAGYLADVGCKLLPHASRRQLMVLLTAVTASDKSASQEDVRRLLTEAGDRLVGEGLQGLSPTVLVCLAQPLSQAVSRNMLASQGEGLLRAAYAELLASGGLQACDAAQLRSLWAAQQRADVVEPSFDAALRAAAVARGVDLPARGSFHDALGPLGL